MNASSISLTEEKDILYSGFKLHRLGITSIGTPTFEQWLECNAWASKVNGAVHFWIGDLLNYGENTYGEMYSQALDETGFDYETLRDDKWIAKEVPLSLRNDNLTRTHAHTIAALPQKEKEYWSSEIKKEKMSVRDLKERIKAKRKLELGTPMLPEGKFNVIYADPPWQYDFSETDSRQIENQYPTMSVEEISELKVPAYDNAVLYLWATAPKLREALKVVESWGFEYKTNLIWDKQTIGMGYWFRGQHELLLVATKGEFSPPEESLRVPSVFSERKTKHSKKPSKFHEWIELWYPNEKYLELFARNKYSDKWTVYGNQL